MEYGSFRIIASVVSFMMLALILLVPFSEPPGSFVFLDGSPVVMDHIDIWSSSGPLAAFVYGLGDISCHQQYARSIIVNGSQLAFCIRDTSILIGLLLGFLSSNVLSQRFLLSRWPAWLFITSLVVMFADVFLVGDVDILWTATGLFAGVTAAYLIQGLVLNMYVHAGLTKVYK